MTTANYGNERKTRNPQTHKSKLKERLFYHTFGPKKCNTNGIGSKQTNTCISQPKPQEVSVRDAPTSFKCLEISSAKVTKTGFLPNNTLTTKGTDYKKHVDIL